MWGKHNQNDSSIAQYTNLYRISEYTNNFRESSEYMLTYPAQRGKQAVNPLVRRRGQEAGVVMGVLSSNFVTIIDTDFHENKFITNASGTPVPAPATAPVP